MHMCLSWWWHISYPSLPSPPPLHSASWLLCLVAVFCCLQYPSGSLKACLRNRLAASHQLVRHRRSRRRGVPFVYCDGWAYVLR